MVWRSALLSSASREVAAMRRRRTGRISMRIADCAWACAYCNSLSNSSMDSDCTGWNLSPRAYSWRLWSNWRATGRVSRLVERSKDVASRLPLPMAVSKTAPSLWLRWKSSISCTMGRKAAGVSFRITAWDDSVSSHHCHWLYIAVGNEASAGWGGSQSIPMAAGWVVKLPLPQAFDQKMGRKRMGSRPADFGVWSRTRPPCARRARAAVSSAVVTRTPGGGCLSREAGEADLAERRDAAEGESGAREIAMVEQAAGVIGHAPCGCGVGQSLAAVVGDFGLCGEGFGGGPDEFLHARERNGLAVEAAELFGRENAFGVPEGIEQADECLALSREILQLEQEEASEIGRAQGGLHILFIDRPGEFAGGVLEIVGLVGHAARGELVAEDF